MGKQPATVWSSGDDSSSVYSQETSATSVYAVTPRLAISRKDSSSSTQTKTPTIFNDDTIKALGYTPFEYWKGPRPITYPQPPRSSAAARNSKRRRAPPPPPSLLSSSTIPPPPPVPPPPAVMVNSLHDFKPMPPIKLREVRDYISATTPASPTVKDRYIQRQAERMRRNREAERLRKLAEWPGWAPDARVLKRAGSEHHHHHHQHKQQQQQRNVRIADEIDLVDEKGIIETRQQWRMSAVSSIFSAMSERWWRPRTWRRRVWGIVATTFMLLMVAVIIIATTLSQDNFPSKPKR